MSLLLLSLLPLAFGPLIVRFLHGSARLSRFLNGFVLVSVAGIIFIYIFPHSIQQAGWPAAVAALLGVMLPFGLERILGHADGRSRYMATLLGLSAIGLHGLLDGVVLAGASVGNLHWRLLAYGVILHRIPVGIAIWWLAAPRMGTARAAAVLAILMGASVLGYGLAFSGLTLFSDSSWYVLQALLAGSLLHVIMHQLEEPRARPRLLWGSVLGVLCAIVLLAGISMSGHDHGHGHSSLGSDFLQLARMTATPLVLGFLASFVLRWKWRGLHTRISRTMWGMLLLPELSLSTLLLGLVFLGWKLSLLKASMVLLAAGLVAVGLRSHSSQQAEGATPMHLLEGFMAEVVDVRMPWIIVSLGLAAMLQHLVPDGSIERLALVYHVPMASLAAAPVYVAATASLPVVAVLLYKGLSAGGLVAWALAGAARRPEVKQRLAHTYGSRTAAQYRVMLVLLALLFGLSIDYLFPESAGLVQVHSLQGFAQLSEISLSILAILLLWSLLRCGLSGYVTRVWQVVGHDHEYH